MGRTPTTFSVWEVDLFPCCALCDTRLHDPRFKYSVRMTQDGAVYVARAKEPLVCIGCEEPHDTILLFKSFEDAEAWMLEVTQKRGEKLPVIELDSDGEPKLSEDTYLVF